MPSPTGPEKLSVASLGDLTRRLGVDHETTTHYKSRFDEQIEQVRKDEESAKSPDDRFAGKPRFKTVLLERRTKAEKRFEAAKLAQKKAVDEVEACTKEDGGAGHPDEPAGS